MKENYIEVITDPAEFNDEEKYSAALAALSWCRREKIDKCKTEESKRLSLAAGISIKRALEVLNIDEKSMSYTVNEEGKPYFSDASARLFFSISHTRGKALCIVSEHEVGCDIERTERFEISDERAEKIFEKVKCWIPDYDIEQLKHSQKTSEYLARVWTIAEARAKAGGTGIFKHPVTANGVFDIDRYITETKILADGYVMSVCLMKE